MKKLAFFMSMVMVICIAMPTASAAVNTSLPAANPPRGLEQRVMDRLEINTDTRGWLYIPGTTINQVIVQDRPSPEDAGKGSHFYFNHGFDKEELEAGTPYIDFRCNMRLGAMPRNTIIYGHSDTDDPNGANFSQLKKYLDDDFAKKHPYIYYSDGRNTYTFMVFAVFKTHINLEYNVPDLSTEKMRQVLNTAKDLSVREYNNQPSDSARILTLSTGVSSVDSSETYFPASYFRFVVMAKAIVPPGTTTA